MGEYEAKEDLQICGEMLSNDDPGFCCPFFPGEWRQGIGDMGQNVEQITLFRIDDSLHFREMVSSETFFGEAFQQLSARVGTTPDGSQFFFVLEELRQLAKRASMNCCADMGVPSGCQKLVATIC